MYAEHTTIYENQQLSEERRQCARCARERGRVGGRAVYWQHFTGTNPVHLLADGPDFVAQGC